MDVIMGVKNLESRKKSKNFEIDSLGRKKLEF